MHPLPTLPSSCELRLRVAVLRCGKGPLLAELGPSWVKQLNFQLNEDFQPISDIGVCTKNGRN